MFGAWDGIPGVELGVVVGRVAVGFVGLGLMRERHRYGADDAG